MRPSSVQVPVAVPEAAGRVEFYDGKAPSDQAASFLGMVHNIDQNIGKVLGALAASGQAANIVATIKPARDIPICQCSPAAPQLRALLWKLS